METFQEADIYGVFPEILEKTMAQEDVYTADDVLNWLEEGESLNMPI